MLRVSSYEEKILRLEDTIARLKEAGRPTETHDAFLRTLRDTLALMKEHFKRLSAPPLTYRCYLMMNGTVRAVHICDCRDDAEALIEAAKLLEGTTFEHIEIWQGRRIVGRIPRRQKQS